jgi:anti-sigma factor RsiW
MSNVQDTAMRIELVHAYVDGELDPINSLAVGQQIAADPALGAEAARIEALRNAVRERLPREPLPPHLKSKIEAAIGGRSASTGPSWRALAASVVVGMALASSSTWFALGPASGDRLAQAVVDSHLRALMAPEAADVKSSERHIVKPWFNGRIPESPQVIDLASEGFPLIGGRVDVVDAKPAATLVYGRRLHRISLLASPSAGPEQEPSIHKAIKGTNLVHWTKDGIAYWAASDLNAGELGTFAHLFRAGLQPR